MPIACNDIEKVFERSLTKFLKREASELLNDVSERNNCARFAMYMQQIADEAGLNGYYADAEYNRKQTGRVKTILDDEMKEVEITADLILHGRGENLADDNLIAVEIKKSTRPRHEKMEDRNRLRAMTKATYDGVWSNDGTTNPEHVCGYRLGVYIEIKKSRREARLEYYVGGERVAVKTRFF